MPSSAFANWHLPIGISIFYPNLKKYFGTLLLSSRHHEDPPSLRHACPRTRTNCHQVKTCRAYSLRPPCASPPHAPSRAPPIALTGNGHTFYSISPKKNRFYSPFPHPVPFPCTVEYARFRSAVWCLTMGCKVVISSHELDLPTQSALPPAHTTTHLFYIRIEPSLPPSKFTSIKI